MVHTKIFQRCKGSLFQLSRRIMQHRIILNKIHRIKTGIIHLTIRRFWVSISDIIIGYFIQIKVEITAEIHISSRMEMRRRICMGAKMGLIHIEIL